MVTVTNYFVRNNQAGEPFIALELTGDLEMIQSSETGRFYAAAKRCTVSSVFEESIAKTLVGKQLPGSIDRVECEQYDYVVPGTTEVRTLTHTYVYSPTERQSPAKALAPVQI